MSGFYGQVISGMYATIREDLRLNRMDFQPYLNQCEGYIDNRPTADASFATDFWPGTAGFYGAPNIDVYYFPAVQWGDRDPCSGAAMRYALAGYTRDAYGSIIPGVTVKAFRTSDDSLQATAVSDGNGFFTLNTQFYPDAHYMVAHKAGFPDIDGISVNTLIGT